MIWGWYPTTLETLLRSLQFYFLTHINLKIQVFWDSYTRLTGKLLTTMEEHNVPFIRVKQSRGGHTKTYKYIV